MKKKLASIMDNSVVICDDVIESCEGKKDFNEKKTTCKTQNLYILLAFLSIAIALLITVSIYCYLIIIEQNENVNYHFTSQITNQRKVYMKNINEK